MDKINGSEVADFEGGNDQRFNDTNRSSIPTDTLHAKEPTSSGKKGSKFKASVYLPGGESDDKVKLLQLAQTNEQLRNRVKTLSQALEASLV